MSCIHLLIVADTECHDIGQSVVTDVNRMIAKMKDYSHLADMWLSTRVITQTEFNADDIAEAIWAMSPGPDDTIVFYYSGHGMRAEGKRDVWPMMATGRNLFGEVNGFDINWIYRWS